MSGTDSVVGTLSPLDVDRLVERFRRAAPRPRATAPRPHGPVPLSSAQERLWLLATLDPASTAYNIPTLVALAGALDAPALARALARVVGRHEVLRSRFIDTPEGPRQQVVENRQPSLPLVDLTALPSPRRCEQRAAIAASDARCPFDLSRGPLLRATLIRQHRDRHALLLDVHHIAADGWSMSVLVGELASSYAASRTDRPWRVPPLTMQYADYARWQRQRLDDGSLDTRIERRQGQLAGCAPLEVPLDRPRRAHASRRAGRLPLTVSAPLAVRLRAQAEAADTTLFVLLLSAFGAVLGHSAGRTDLSVGSPVAHRLRREHEGLIGFFANTLVLRLDLAGDPSWRTLVARTAAQVTTALDHQEVPFERLVEGLAPERSLAHDPLVQAMLALLDAPPRASLPGLEVERLDVAPATAKLDLLVSLMPEADGSLRGFVEYRADLFAASSVHRLMARFGRLLSAAAHDPDLALASLLALDDGERHQVLVAWNDTARRASANALLHQRVATSARTTPDAPAVVDGERSWSYRELVVRAAQIAAHLEAQGIGAEDRVAIYAGRRVETVTAILGVLACGAAYVPVDPAYPAARTRLVLADSGAALVLAGLDVHGDSGPWQELGLPAISLTDVDTPAEDLKAAAQRIDGPPSLSAASLAYVIYTSGSSGRPKGVAITHGGAAALVRWALDRFSPADWSGTLASTSWCFDLSVFELFVPLAAGGTVILAEDVLALPRLAAASQVRLINTVPSALTELLGAGPLPSGVRTINVAGEPLRRDLVEQVHAAAPKARLWNLYGPSEDTTYSTWAVIPRQGAEKPAIGRPVDDTRAYVVNGSLDPLPIGVTGELFLAGAGLARGYLDQPARTAERFVPDPFAGRPGERLYRTGDLVRWRADGELIFLGRDDRQIKIRGFRIEPGEVEAVLAGHPEIAQVAVTVVPSDTLGPRLAAYLVPASNGSAGEPGGPDADAVRAFAMQQLPAHEVPTHVVFLDRLPRTATGKVDLAALPAPDDRASGGAAPSTVTEAAVTAILAEVLARAEVPADRSFFALGGHSLLATRVVVRVRERLGVDLPLRALFEASSAIDLARVIERARDADRHQAQPRLGVVPEDDRTLSFAQERLWFLDQLSPGSAAYNVPAAVRLDGALDGPSLSFALSCLVARHSSLRSRFPSRHGAPLLVVDAPGDPLPSLALVDLCSLDDAQREARIEGLLAVAAGQPFDLAPGPLLRALLVRSKPDRHVLLLTVHHMVVDAWSMRVLIAELAAVYRSRQAGRSAELAPLAVQYADFAVWQRQWLRGEVLEHQVSFWRRALADLPALDLPADAPIRGHHRTLDRGASLPVVLSGAEQADLERVARRHGATLFMVLAAAFATVLGRAAGQSDVALGIPTANRRRSELENVVGMFVNTLVLRVDLGGRPGWGDLIGRVRRASLAADTHQDVPFEQLVEALAPARATDSTPLVQALFAWQHAPPSPPSLPGIEVTELDVHTAAVKVDVGLSLTAQAEGVRGLLEYRDAHFSRPSMERLLAAFRQVLSAMVAGRAPDAGALLGAGLRHQLVVEWNDTAGPPPQPSLADYVARQVARTPDAVAVEAADEVLSYRALDRRANALASQLRDLGVGPDVAVAVCLPRDSRWVVTALAVQKAGGVYVPLEPSYPASRLAYMLADARAAVLISVEALADRLPRPLPGALATTPEHVLWLGRLPPAERDPVDAVEKGGEALAYLLYTSGSTGRPKGVAVPQRAAATLIGWALRAFAPEELEGVLAATSISFDLSIFELFVPLAAGGRVVVAEQVLDLPGLAASPRVTLINTVPSALDALLTSGGMPPGVRAVNLAGEALPAALVARIHGALPRVRVRNLYGPTEDTTYSTWSEVSTGPADAPRPIGRPAIGRPISGTRAYVVDAEIEPVPIGTAGELFLGGAGLARGYHGQPAMTAERFVPDPFGGPGGRLYRTGDRVRWYDDGRLDFLGRLDQQVKIRGFRIEPGEVEAALLALDGIEAAAVMARAAGEPHREQRGDRGSGADLRLVAYLVAPSGLPAADTLRRELSGSLPGHLLPAAYMALPELPMTLTGKLDRHALPAPDWGAVARPDRAPRTVLESQVAELWRRLLGVPKVGVDDDFFALGGHSLLAVRLLSRLRSSLGVSLAVRELFDAPTVAGLAARVEAARAASGEQPAAPQVLPRPARPPLSFIQERLWLLHQVEPTSATLGMTMRVRLEGSLALPALAHAMTAVVARHEALRTVFPSIGGVPYQHVLPASGQALAVIDLSGIGQTIAGGALVRAERLLAGRAYDLERGGPLLRAAVARRAPAVHVLVLDVHHIVFDGWSGSVLVRELAACFQATGAGRPAVLPELPLQYADYAVWQRQDDERFADDLSYWRAQLDGIPAGLDLPTDRLRPARQRHRGGHVRRRLPADRAEAVRSLGEDATLFMTLLAVLGGLLSRWSGQREVVIGSPVANRDHPQLEGLVGPFLDNVALRVDAGGDPAFDQLLAQVRSTVLDAFEHRALPFERLLQAIRPDRVLDRTPLFQVFLNVLSFPAEPLEVPGLSLEIEPPATLPARFDLTFYVEDRGDAITLDLVYDRDLFGRETADELIDQFVLASTQAAAAPSRPIGAWSLVTQRAHGVLPDPGARLDATWRGGIHQIFARHAEEQPTAPAVVEAAGETWSYSDLDRLGNRLAQALVAGGVAPHQVVAIRAHRGAGLVAAMLGIWKAGAAFLVLDPAHPKRRARQALEVVDPVAIVELEAAGPGPAAVTQWFDQRRRLRLAVPATRDAANASWAHVPSDDPKVAVGPDDPAYVSLTSGSTGMAKGVLGRHGSRSHFTPWLDEHFGYRPDDRFSMLCGLAHDALHRDVLTPLQGGGCLMVPDPEHLGTPGYLACWLAASRVTVAHLTPAMLRLIADHAAPGCLPDLRRVVTVGEALTLRQVERFEALAPSVRVINIYGATETQGAVSWFPLERPRPAPDPLRPRREVVPLGRGIQDVQLLLRNRHGGLAGVGEQAEIVVRSPHIALGYLGDPALTAERFIANPWADDPRDAVYLSGDLGHYRHDGTVAFRGRGDQQVKIRGYRVELEEIASVLSGHPAVDDAAVIQWRDDPRASAEEAGNESLLAAYWVSAERVAEERAADRSVDEDALSRYLADRLPDYMLPMAFVRLEALPLTPNRKLDRRALPAPVRRSRSLERQYVAPRNDLERTLAATWCEVLDVERVGVGDDFFRLGGHSLLATQMLARLQEELGREVPLRTVFEHPTVAGLAEVLAPAPTAAAPSVEPIGRRPSAARIPLSFAQQRLFCLDQLEPGNAAFNLPTALRLEGALDRIALACAVAALTARHETLRTGFAFDAADGQPVQRIVALLPAGIPLVDLSGLLPAARDQQVERAATLLTRRPFELATPPLWRLALLDVAASSPAEGAPADDHILILTLHHIISDGWSTGVLVRELRSLYQGFTAGEAPEIPDLPIQYGDYARWQRLAAAGGEGEDEALAAWCTRLARFPQSLDLPTDRMSGPHDRPRGGWRSLAWDAELADELEALAKRSSTTLFMVLMAGFHVLLARLTGRQRLLVGTDVANRPHRELEGLIGFFVNQLVIPGDLTGDPPFDDLLEQVRADALTAFGLQEVPFERVVRRLVDRRSVERSPLFQVKLIVQNVPFSPLALPGLTIRPIEVPARAAQQQLVIALWREPAGLRGWVSYRSDRFQDSTVSEWLTAFEHILRAAAADSARPVSALLGQRATFGRAERKPATMADSNPSKRTDFGAFRARRGTPVAVPLEPTELVERTEIAPGQGLPQVVRPKVDGVDLKQWAEGARDEIERDLVDRGAVLFRGFQVTTPEAFEAFASAVCNDLFDDNGEHPHESLTGNVYTPVHYAPNKKLLWHNENSFNQRWPRKILFCCAQPAARGGETPLADSRKVYDSVDPAVRQRFVDHGVAYIRNYLPDGVGLPWQQVFQTEDRREVERVCAENDLELTWSANGDSLRTRCVRPAVVRHPQTGEASWFNQAQHWHPSCLDEETRASLLGLFGLDGLPRHCTFGDGSSIPDEDMAHVLSVYQRLEVVFPWQRGDVVLVDNVLAAHSRNPYEGERKLLVAMGDMLSFEAVEA